MKVTQNLTHSENGRVIRDLRRLWLLVFLLLLSYRNVFHVASPEHNVFIDTGRRGDLLRRITSPTFCAMRNNVLECNGRIFRVDFMQNSNITVVSC